MWNTIRREEQENNIAGLKKSLLLVAAMIVIICWMNQPKEQVCMWEGCGNECMEDGVYCTEHQMEFEEYKSKAYNYENSVPTYSVGSVQYDGEYNSDFSKYESWGK